MRSIPIPKCPVCAPAAFDGALDVVPVAVPCLAHAGLVVQFGFPDAYEIPSSQFSIPFARLALPAPAVAASASRP